MAGRGNMAKPNKPIWRSNTRLFITFEESISCKTEENIQKKV
jgi:hypothetical protein